MAEAKKTGHQKVVSVEFGNNFDGGGSDMHNNDYVTHSELNSAVDKLSHKIDLLDAHIDTKFEKQKVWFYGTGISVVVAIIGILKFIF
ncbi:hypothetical protein [Furfurilactobacillus siliginis]|uniref:Uncharacterized protein n=1 Tax=Furfurilactobacillus siliginis TaxID=348151 RepID=A0A0R2L5R8_9LACO|nr:hypothetical protein [Furfurilactobacillus siliginis]KRN96817.1 hypothetical protein IV55_GL000681 [Furfurilactobacillus siliginis]GEK28479.1 hypothetical protein LSI01_07900 [Furfurilactobacillus siliginis]